MKHVHWLGRLLTCEARLHHGRLLRGDLLGARCRVAKEAAAFARD